jgi:transposase-like protein
MKSIEKKQALILRGQGKSIKDISKELNVAKSSVSVWVRKVELTETQKTNLKQKGLFREKIERTRQTRLNNEKIKRDIIINKAKDSIISLNKLDLLLVAVALYWGEGGKTRRTVRFSNSDPDLIRIMMKFFREICNVPEEKFRGYIHIHEHLDHKKAERYWSQISGITLDKMYATYRKQSISSKGKKRQPATWHF